MFIISKTIKGKEFMYSKNCMIKCESKKQANFLCECMNVNNSSLNDDFKLKENELYYVYSIDKYDTQPNYRISIRKNKFYIVEI
jgi:hypothetical protein